MSSLSFLSQRINFSKGSQCVWVCECAWAMGLVPCGCFGFTSMELALVLPTKHPLARLPELTKEDLYRLGFVCLDAQSTTRKMVDQLLARSGLDLGRLKIEMELNSFEAIKNAVQSGLGAAFLPVVSIERELAAGSLHRPQVADLSVRRQLKLISHPARYCSRASEAFRREVLPVFASPESPLRRPLQSAEQEASPVLRDQPHQRQN